MIREPMRTAMWTAALTLLVAAPIVGGDADWPQWRGPDRSGVSSDSDLLDRWPLAGPRLLLRIPDVGPGYSSVAIVDGRLFTLGARNDGEYAIAYRADTGRELWATRIGPKVEIERGEGPRSTPTVHGKNLYVLSSGGELASLTAASGKLRWSFNLVERYGGESPRWGWSESPLVDGGRVIGLSGGEGGAIFAVDAATGETVWRSTGLTDGAGYASGVVAEVGGVRQVVHFTAEAAVGVRLEDGKPMWRYERVANRTANCSTPLVRGDEAFFTSEYNTGAALLRMVSSEGETSATEVYFTTRLKNQHGGVVFVDGYVYGHHHALLLCMNWKTGERTWRDRSIGKGSLTAADGKLYVLSEAGRVGLVRANPGQYEELSRFDLERRDGPKWAHPVVIGGRMYLRNFDEILVYDVKNSHLTRERQRFEDAVYAYRDEKFEVALAALRPMAESGYAEAQNYLGLLHRDGKGVEANEAEAVRWFERAARAGDAKAMFNLGATLTTPDSASLDLERGCMWFQLALDGGVSVAGKALEMCAEALTENQMERSRALAAAWKEKS